MTLTRFDLEKELVNYDRQKLITECLKLFDSNKGLIVELEMNTRIGLNLKGEVKDLKAEVDRLKRRKLFGVINDRLDWKIARNKKRRESVNYPMK